MNKKFLSIAFILIILIGSQATFAKDYLGGKLYYNMDKKIELEATWERDIDVYSSFDVKLSGAYEIHSKYFVMALVSSVEYDLFKFDFLNPKLGNLFVGAGLSGGIALKDGRKFYAFLGPKFYADWNINSKLTLFAKLGIAPTFVWNFEAGDRNSDVFVELKIGAKWEVNDKITVGLEVGNSFDAAYGELGIGLTAGMNF